jgi:hypothetical protein
MSDYCKCCAVSWSTSGNTTIPDACFPRENCPLTLEDVDQYIDSLNKDLTRPQG